MKGNPFSPPYPDLPLRRISIHVREDSMKNWENQLSCFYFPSNSKVEHTKGYLQEDPLHPYYTECTLPRRRGRPEVGELDNERSPQGLSRDTFPSPTGCEVGDRPPGLSCLAVVEPNIQRQGLDGTDSRSGSRVVGRLVGLGRESGGREKCREVERRKKKEGGYSPSVFRVYFHRKETPLTDPVLFSSFDVRLPSKPLIYN